MRRLYIGVLALLRIDAATIDAVRRTSKAAVYGAGNASHAQHYAATFASLRCGGFADRFLFLDEPAPASAPGAAAEVEAEAGPAAAAPELAELQELHGPLGAWYAASGLAHGEYPATPEGLADWPAFGEMTERFLAAAAL